MGFALVLRTIVVTPWLAGLLWHGGADALTAVLTVALVAVWAMPLARRVSASAHPHKAVAHRATAG